MTTLTIDLPSDILERLQAEAARTGKRVEELASELLTERMPVPVASERERAREVLRAAGLLTELGPELKRRAAEASISLDEIHAILGRAGGKPLSEIAIEQRGPKEYT